MELDANHTKYCKVKKTDGKQRKAMQNYKNAEQQNSENIQNTEDQ